MSISLPLEAKAKNNNFKASLIMNSSPSSLHIPLWWEIEIFLIAYGNYSISQEKTIYSGNYSFSIIWTGCMEIDDDDFLIYHEDSELREWDAQEKSFSPQGISIFRGDEFSERPTFVFNYILKEKGILHFNFKIEGFYVPQNKSHKKYYLELPASHENSKSSPKINYNLFILQGSNRVTIEESNLMQDMFEKTFQWRWQFPKGSGERNQLDSFSSSHEAKCKVTIISHQIKSVDLKRLSSSLTLFSLNIKPLERVKHVGGIYRR